MFSNDYNPLDQMEKPEVTLIENRKCNASCWQILVLTILMCIVTGLGVFISVTYVLNPQCKKENLQATSDNSISFLLFSDIHLDPFYEEEAPKSSFCRNKSTTGSYKAKYGRIGCDSPMSLLRSVLAAMKIRSSNQCKTEFILLTGDTSAHRTDRLFPNSTTRRKEVLKIIKASNDEVSSAFPSIPYFPCIGNNDLPGHYVMPGYNDTWYSDLLDIWQDSILCRNCPHNYTPTTKDELRRTFLNGGYYNASVADDTMTLLVLNSMYWTKSTWKPYAYFTEIAQTQMEWLEIQLNLAKKLRKKVLITSHIPPGIDPQSSTQTYNTLWLANYTNLYTNLVNKFSDAVAAQFYAHFHKDSFRFLQDEKRDPSIENSSFVLLTPSVSPVYRNNPSFRVVHVDPDLQALTDYEQYYMNLVMATEFNNPVWQLDYRFSTKYRSKGVEDKVINAMRIKYLSDNLINQTNDDIFTGFINSRQVRYQPDPFSRFIYYCAVRFSSLEDFNVCQKKYNVPGG